MDQDEMIRHIAEDRARERQLARENAQRRKRLAKAAAAVSSHSGTSSTVVPKDVPTVAPGSGQVGSRPTTTSDYGLSTADAMSTCTITTATTTNHSSSARHAMGQQSLLAKKRNSYTAVQIAGSERVTAGALPARTTASSPRQQQQVSERVASNPNPSASLKEFIAVEEAVQQWATDVEAPSPTLPSISSHQKRSGDTAAVPQRPATCDAVLSPAKNAKAITVNKTALPTVGKAAPSLQRTSSAPALQSMRPPKATPANKKDPKSIIKRFPIKRQLNVKNVQFTNSTRDTDGPVQFIVHDNDQDEPQQFAAPYTSEFIQQQCDSAAANAENCDFGPSSSAVVDGGQELGSDSLFQTPQQSALVPSPTNEVRPKKKPQQRPAFVLNNSSKVKDVGPSITVSKRRTKQTTTLGTGPSVTASGTFHTGVTLEEKALEEALSNINKKMAHKGGVSSYANMATSNEAEFAEAEETAEPVLTTSSEDAKDSHYFVDGSDANSNSTTTITTTAEARGNVTNYLRDMAAKRLLKKKEQDALQREHGAPLPMMNLARNPLIRRGTKASSNADGNAPPGPVQLLPPKKIIVAGGPSAQTNVVLPRSASSQPDALPRRDLRSGKRISYVRPN